MAEEVPELQSNFYAALPEPSLMETGAAAFKSNVIGSLLYQPVLMEKLRQTDNTPVTDGEIEARVNDERLNDYLGNFTDTKTQGELDARINKIKYERDNKRILEAAGWYGTGAQVVAGILDLPSLIPVVGQIGVRGGSIARQAGMFAVTGTVQATASEAGLLATNETHTLGESVGTIAGATILSGILGAGIARVITAKEAARLGDGVKKELVKSIDGTLGKEADTLASKVAERTKYWSERDYTDSDLAKAFTSRFGAEPTPTQLALADTLGMDKVSRTAMKALGGSAKLELIASPSQTAREFAANMFEYRTGLVNGADQMVAPETVTGLKTLVDGPHAQARQGIVDNWKDWASERSTLFPALERNLSDEQKLATFSDLVFKARIAGDKAEQMFGAEAAAEIMHPKVQAATAAYGKFNDHIGNMAVDSGLMRREALRDNHVRHIFDGDALSASRDRYIKTESTHAFDTEWAKDTAAAAVAKNASIGHVEATHAKALSNVETWFKRHVEEVKERALRAADKTSVKRYRQDVKELQSLYDDGVKADLKAREPAFDADTDRLERNISKNINLTTEEYWGKVSALHADRSAKWDDIKAKVEASHARDAERRQAAIDREYGIKPGRLDYHAIKLADMGLPHKYNPLDHGSDALTGLRADLAAAKGTPEAAQLKLWYDAAKAADTEINNPKAKALLKQAEEKAIKKAEKEKAARIEAADSFRRSSLEQARIAHAEATGIEARVAKLEWSQAHAEGNFKAKTIGWVGNQMPDGITGGNVRGGRIASNTYTPTEILVKNGWLDTDIMRVMERQARQDGMDAVIAKKFRRLPTEEEQKLFAKQGSKEAYWADGRDPYTLPDLNGSHIKERIVKDYMSQGAQFGDDLLAKHGISKNVLQGGDLAFGATKADYKAAGKLAAQAERDLASIDETLAVARGQHQTDTFNQAIRPVVGLLKAWNFSALLGQSLLTNTADAFRLGTYHGVGTTWSYMTARMAEKFRDGKVFGDMGRVELREYASAFGWGLEHYTFNRVNGMADLADPFAMSRSDSKMDAVSSALAMAGGKFFGLNWWNNTIKTAAYGMSQYKLSSLALGKQGFNDLAAADREWLKYIGFGAKDLQDLRGFLQGQGMFSVKGADVARLNPELLISHNPSLGERYMSAMHKDVTTAVITPDNLSAPRFMHYPLAQAAFQFASFSLAAAEGITMRGANQLKNGQAGLVTQGVIGLMAGATFAWLMKGLASGDLDKRIEQFERNPGQTFYQLFDNAGILPLFTVLNNMAEDITGIGLKRLSSVKDSEKFMYDPGTPGASFRSQGSGDPGKAILGATGSQLKTGVQVLGSSFDSLLNKFDGGNRKGIDDATYRKAAGLVPFAGALPLKVGARAVEATIGGRGLEAFHSTVGVRRALEGGVLDPLAPLFPAARR